jgi:hypothetical protein
MAAPYLPTFQDASIAKFASDFGVDLVSREPINAQRFVNRVGGAGKTISAQAPIPPTKKEIAYTKILNTPTPSAARLPSLKDGMASMVGKLQEKHGSPSKMGFVEGKVAMIPSKVEKLPFISKEKAEATISGLYKKFNNPQEVFTAKQYASYKKGDLDDSDLRQAVINKTKGLIQRDINKKFTTDIDFTDALYEKVYDKYQE